MSILANPGISTKIFSFEVTTTIRTSRTRRRPQERDDMSNFRTFLDPPIKIPNRGTSFVFPLKAISQCFTPKQLISGGTPPVGGEHHFISWFEDESLACHAQQDGGLDDVKQKRQKKHKKHKKHKMQCEKKMLL